MIGTILALSILTPQQIPKVFLWDYPTADIELYQINRFELSIDGGEFGDVGRMGYDDQSAAAPGDVTYVTPIPALTPGEHRFSVRACNVTECSTAEVVTFIVTIKPTPVKNPRIGGGL